MLFNYIKIAWRKLFKNKVDSVISIGGLAVGLACCILLALSVRFELTYDNFHENSDRIFRVTDLYTQSSGEKKPTLTHPHSMAAVMDSTFPEIDYAVRLSRGRSPLKRDDKFYPQSVLYADPGFFKMFNFQLVSGNKSTVLSNPQSIVLTETMEENLFGEEQALGKTLTFRMNKEELSFQVTGVAKDVPDNSSIQFEMIMPFESILLNYQEKQRKTARQSWYVRNNETWMMLNKNASAKGLENKFPEFIKTHFGPLAERMSFDLQPMDDVYFNQKYDSRVTANSNIQYSIILGAIVIVILSIAGMNFMSLTLSRISDRHNELGVRKAAGAKRKQLSFQLIGEIFITCGIALAAGIVLAEMLTPYFRQVTQKPVHMGIISEPVSWLVLGGILLLITLITGIYPAIVIYRKKATLLFGSQRSAERIPLFVKGLTVAQFALTIGFLIVTFTMQEQLNYLLNKDLGFSSSNVISVEFGLEDDRAMELAALYRQETQRLPGVQAASITGSNYNRYLGQGSGMASMNTSTTFEEFEKSLRFELIDENYLETMAIELAQGRDFSMKRSSEIKEGVIVNQQFVNVLGWKNPVGRIIHDDGGTWQGMLDGKKIIGVIEDYHFQSLHNTLQPLVLRHIEAESYGEPGAVLVKANREKMPQIKEQLGGLWNKILPQQPFNYTFLDDLLSEQYQTEQRWNMILKFSSVIAMVLACFGLFGLAALSAQRRTKEIGIRKVFGATLFNIVAMMNKDFLKMVVLGFVISIPVAWYIVRWWLTDFAYRIEIGAGIFLLAGIVAVIIALATVSWQSIRAALANPVESLRNE